MKTIKTEQEDLTPQEEAALSSHFNKSLFALLASIALQNDDDEWLNQDPSAYLEG